MQNHIHLIWQMQPNNKPAAVQRDFLKYTAQQIKSGLQKNHPDMLAQLKVNSKDRTYLPITIGMEKKFIKYRIKFNKSISAKIRLHTLQPC